GNTRVGFHRRTSVSRPANASARDRGVERGAPCIDSDARLHDRDRSADAAGEATMNGVHDMGGSHGFGPVVREAHEPTFHAEWEGRVFALTMAAGRPGKWNIDMGRFARENRPPADYLNKSYFEIWLAGLETLLAERGLVSADEIAAGHPLGEPKKVDGLLRHDDVEAVLHRGRPTERPARVPARFRIGDRVRARNIHPMTHTRLPRYV